MRGTAVGLLLGFGDCADVVFAVVGVEMSQLHESMPVFVSVSLFLVTGLAGVILERIDPVVKNESLPQSAGDVKETHPQLPTSTSEVHEVLQNALYVIQSPRSPR